MVWGNLANLVLATIVSASPNEAKANNPNNLNNLTYFMGVCNGATAVDTATMTLKPIRPNGTFKVQVNENGLYVFAIQPPILPTDTLDLTIIGPSGTTHNDRTADSLSNQYKNLQLFENGFGANIQEILDSTGVAGDIYGIVKFNSNPSESLVVLADTAGTKFTDFAADLKQLSGCVPGAGYTIDLRKGTAHKLIESNVTEAQGMGMYAAMTAVLKHMTGIELERTVNKRNLPYKKGIYDITGRQVTEMSPNGIYFVVEKQGDKPRKVLQLK